MSFINELKARSDNAENNKSAVIEEIKGYFDRYLDGDGLEKYLRASIRESEIKERKTFMKVDFWEYHDGCSTTHFSCGGRLWLNPENNHGYESHTYKGVELRTIDKEVCGYLTTRLMAKMNEMGFHLVSKEDHKSRFGYYETYFYFGW